MDPRLITIPFSHYCEKARWALDRAGVRYTEEGHLPVFHARAVRRAGGVRQVPVLVTDEGVIDDSTQILAWTDARVDPARRLFPDDPARRAEVARWEDRFDDALGPHARRWGYGKILPERAFTTAQLRKNVPAWEHRLLRVAYPFAAALLRRGLKVSAAGVARSEARVRAVFDEVSTALGDGRRYLAGDRLTAADVAFAALAAPVLLPDGYAPWLFAYAEAPSSMRPLVDALRDTPAGRFGLRVYAEDRR
ncbi:MAG: glutathione S-transferase family protein [Polyangiales bacterium]